MSPSEVDAQIKLFESKQGQYIAFQSALKGLVSQLLLAADAEIVTMESRTKSIESFKGKITREDKNYSDPINEITDLVGIRIITYQLSDLNKVSDIISSNFAIDTENSVDKRQSLEADRFGYVSVHYIVSFNNIRSSLPEYAAFIGLRAEIQIRTVLQHAWAAIDHKLRYKSKEQVPANLRRQLYRISALLETADEQFASLNDGLTQVRVEYSEAVADDSLDLPLDIESLGIYVSTSKNAKELLRKSEPLDINFAPHHPNARLPEFSNLLAFLDRAGIKTIYDFDSQLENISTRIDAFLPTIVSRWKENVSSPGLRLVVTKESYFRMIFFMSLPPERAEHFKSELRFGFALGDAVEQAYRGLYGCAHFTINAPQGSNLIEDAAS